MKFSDIQSKADYRIEMLIVDCMKHLRNSDAPEGVSRAYRKYVLQPAIDRLNAERVNGPGATV